MEGRESLGGGGGQGQVRLRVDQADGVHSHAVKRVKTIRYLFRRVNNYLEILLDLDNSFQ